MAIFLRQLNIEYVFKIHTFPHILIISLITKFYFPIVMICCYPGSSFIFADMLDQVITSVNNYFGALLNIYYHSNSHQRKRDQLHDMQSSLTQFEVCGFPLNSSITSIWYYYLLHLKVLFYLLYISKLPKLFFNFSHFSFDTDAKCFVM